MRTNFNTASVGSYLLSLSALAAPTYALPQHLFGSSFGVPGGDATYDYVIVGGGNAGLTIASRLVEQPNTSVAVIEAGSFYEIGNGNFSQIPAFDGLFTGKSKEDTAPLVDWGYSTVPQKDAYDVEMHYPRGKCLGGSTARNYMVYQRGTEGSYQEWADTVGDNSYTFDNLLPYFKKSITFTPPNKDTRACNATPAYDASVLQGNGPVSVTFPNYAGAWGTWVVKGLEAIGVKGIKGFNSGALIGYAYATFTINAKNMNRESSETSFLRSSLQNPNYIVYQSTMAKKIAFNGKKATGVVVETGGVKYTLSAKKEVIVSAGTFGSPQLLLVSGVGPAADLEKLNIPVVADLPGVGKNMQDHVFFGPSYRVNAITTSSLGIPSFAAAAAKNFTESATGLMTNPSVDILAWEKVPKSLRGSLSPDTQQALDKYPADWPELEYLGVHTYLGLQNNMGSGGPNDGYNYATLAAAIIKPQSRGTVSISSSDTNDQPLIDPNYFAEKADVEVAIAGYKRLRQFFNSTALDRILISDEVFPGSNVTSDADLERVIKTSFNTVFHAACTCSMGKSTDKNAVVDTKGRVFGGVSNLRVVDASIFPFLPPGHPMSTVYAVAEKIAANIISGQ